MLRPISENIAPMPLTKIAPAAYATLLAEKITRFRDSFRGLDLPDPEVFPSQPLHYRMRAEFRIFRQGGRIDYAMFSPDNPKQPVVIDDFPIVTGTIHQLMPRLRDALQASEILNNALFQVDFLATLSGDALVTLIYRRPISPLWEAAAQQLAENLGIRVIGRSRGVKVVIGRDWVEEAFELDGRTLHYRQIEGSFSQPNGEVNRKMLAWARRQATGRGGDLLELYCGNGNFTAALAPLFRKVLATEVAKSSVVAAEHNFAANHLDNIKVFRLSSEEISAALAGTETFRRLEGTDLGEYEFSTIFLDPPRSGLDPLTLELARGFEHILYISCNPQTLLENVRALHDTHAIEAAAVFDQFPYTHHLESGLLLKRRPKTPVSQEM